MSTPAPTSNVADGRTTILHLGDTQNDRVHRLLEILRSAEEIEIAKSLPKSDAQMFLDSVQEVLEQDGLFPRSRPEEDELFHRACRLVGNLSRTAGVLPASLFLTQAASKYKRECWNGAYSDIYSCERHEGLTHFSGPVILKWLRVVGGPEGREKDIHKNLCREALAWRRLHHASVLEFLGIDDKTLKPHVCLVSPFLRNGTIMKYRETKGPRNIPIPTHVIEIAKGLKYIHSESIIHGDLHTGNILIDDKGHAKITDFGLASLVGATTTTGSATSGSGAIHFKAPELFFTVGDSAKLQKKSVKTDVFAFGAVCYELYKGKYAFGNPKAPTPVEIVKSVHQGSHLWLKLPEFTHEEDAIAMPPALWELVRRCWGISSNRPEVSEFLQTLEMGMTP
ncbi:kinase-like domain-containing protein [Mycena vulgaris]|nr:kinase-like domain-containing protein [Mycena vulgaris]